MCSAGSIEACINGAITNKPQSPYTTLGTAANSSIINASPLEIARGAKSARKTAAKIPTGAAMSSARNELTTVPKMNGKAPKSLVMGFQAREMRKWSPKACNDGHDAFTNMAKMPAISIT